MVMKWHLDWLKSIYNENSDKYNLKRGCFCKKKKLPQWVKRPCSTVEDAEYEFCYHINSIMWLKLREKDNKVVYDLHGVCFAVKCRDALTTNI